MTAAIIAVLRQIHPVHVTDDFCVLEGADLRGANLAGANLEGANLEGANLEGAEGVTS